MKISHLTSNRGLEWIKAKIHKFPFIQASKIKPLSRSSSNDSIREISSRLTELAADLENSCKSVEPCFIRLGEDLQAVYSGADDLMRQISASFMLIGGNTEESLLAKVGIVAKESLKEFEECQTRVIESLRDADIVVLQLANLYAQGKMIEKIAMFLRVVGLNVGIETSRSPEATEMFGVVAREVKVLSEKIIDIVKKFLDESESAEAMQLTAQQQITKDLDPLRKLADDAEKEARDAFGQIESFMGLTLKALEKASDHSRKISRQVGEIVMGIQFHDNMNQRIEHITQSIADIEGLCRQETFPETPGNTNTTFEKLSSAHSILTVQVAQLNHVISEIDDVYHKTLRAFAEIMDEIANLAGILTALGSEITENDEAIIEQNKDPFSELKSALENLQRIHKQGTAMFDRIEETATKASEATETLSNHAKQVSGISFATHLIALNAIVKAAHLGDKGSTLEVLAQEVKRLTDQSNTFVGAVEKIFESFTISSQHTTGPIQTNSDATSDSRSEISIEKGIIELSDSYENFKVDSQKTLEKAESLKNSISHTSDGLHFLPDLAVKLNGHLKQLEEIGKSLSPWAALNDDGAVSETHQLCKRYTMHKEREVHQQFLSPAEDLNMANQKDLTISICKQEPQLVECDSGSTSSVASKENISQDHVLKDNAELFSNMDDTEEKDTKGPRQFRKVHHEKQVTDSAENVEPNLEQQTDSEDDFGDNVELF